MCTVAAKSGQDISRGDRLLSVVLMPENHLRVIVLSKSHFRTEIISQVTTNMLGKVFILLYIVIVFMARSKLPLRLLEAVDFVF